MEIVPPNIDRELYDILNSVPDPEIPVLSIIQLGVVRRAEKHGAKAEVEITPTYSGCPAMDVIGDEIKIVLKEAGLEPTVKLILSPAWTTEWITEEGRAALERYGIAAPLSPEADKEALLGNKRIVKCPRCKSTNTKLVSQFGSTACKALFSCEDCLEPFDYFKCLK
jgi:ring-1,2-phenylacetyl-CoA epoxidase subunit PaaD